MDDIVRLRARGRAIRGAVPGRALYNGASMPPKREVALLGPSYAESRVIPCLDVKDGRVVKGVNFVACATPAIRSSGARL